MQIEPQGVESSHRTEAVPHSDEVRRRSSMQRVSLCADDIHEFREIFNLVDTDGSGAISSEELGVLVESVGTSLEKLLLLYSLSCLRRGMHFIM